MKKFYVLLLLFAGHGLWAQTPDFKRGKKAPRLLEDCNTIVINDTEEPAGIVLNNQWSPKVAADIPIASNQSITITEIKVTLTSLQVPAYVHFQFYSNRPSIPADPESPILEVPGDVLIEVTDAQIASYDTINYDPDHELYLRNITMTLANPIVLDGSLVDGRYWMRVVSDANAWACTTHWDTGQDVVGFPLAVSTDSNEYFYFLNLELVYELTADCQTLAVAQNSKPEIVVYPNPVTDVLQIANLPATVSKAEIYNSAGQKIMDIKENFGQINVSGLSGGIYLVKAHDADSVLMSKFVKL